MGTTDRSTADKARGEALNPAANPPAANKELQRILACWPYMPPQFKQTIMTLVEIAEAQRSDTKHC